MIEQEIAEIEADKNDTGERLNRLIDEFRRGRDVNDLVPLLESSNSLYVSLGVYILGELPLELYNSDALISRLRDLTGHSSPAVRFNALGAIFPVLSATDVSTQAMLRRLLGDENEGVRNAAQAAAARLLSAPTSR
jgi:HEAT repeat protein